MAKAAGIDVEPIWPSLFAKALEGQSLDVNEYIPYLSCSVRIIIHNYAHPVCFSPVFSVSLANTCSLMIFLNFCVPIRSPPPFLFFPHLKYALFTNNRHILPSFPPNFLFLYYWRSKRSRFNFSRSLPQCSIYIYIRDSKYVQNTHEIFDFALTRSLALVSPLFPSPGKDIGSLICNVGSGAAAAAAAPAPGGGGGGGGGGETAAEEEKKEEKEEEAEESDDDMGFGTLRWVGGHMICGVNHMVRGGESHDLGGKSHDLWGGAHGLCHRSQLLC